MNISADSRRFVLIGHPVAHSLSPVIHRAAYQDLGLPHSYDLVDCPDEAAVWAVTALDTSMACKRLGASANESPTE